jgi:pyruvate dehydrogenase E2 component (dihydrolipoamide acetyltransferase)
VAFEFKLPDIGEGVAEAEIVRWLVQVGDRVAEDQPLAEVLTDKATVEIPSPRAGTVASLGAVEGAVLKVGAVLVTIEVEDGGTSAAAAAGAPAAAPPAHAAPAVAPPPPAAAAAPAAAGAPPRVEAVPAARMLAKDRGLDLATLRGSGPNGRITLEDVKRALAAREVGRAVAPAAPAAPVAPVAPARPAAAPAGPEERVPLRGLRRKIAEHMSLAARTVPHFTFVAEVDMTAVGAALEAARPAAKAAGVKLTYVAYIVRALLPALRRFPLLNASLDDAAQEIVLKKHYDIGIATATDDGLTVPVVHGADRLGLFDLAREIARLAEGARARKLALEDLTGGTFTLTTTGARGGLLATPIVHHPQVAILGVHAIGPKPVVRDGQIVARDMTNLSLSLDHRVVDGQVGADFLYEVIANLEDPARVPLDEREVR